MTDTVPESGAAFDTMMREIDAAFVQENIPIHVRPLEAGRVISMRYNISIPITKPYPRAPAELQRYAQLGANIHIWYQRVYGERLKIDPSPGRMVTQIDGDLFVVRFPRIYGQVKFLLSPQFIDSPKISGRGPVVCNILQLVDDLTPAKAETLSATTLQSIGADFWLGLHALTILEASQQHELIRIVRGDIETAVSNLMDRGQRYGESKWASLQAAEKTLKAAITFHGAKFKQTHMLVHHSEKLHELGIKFDAGPIIDAIQCSPRIRYGQEDCTRSEALAVT